MRSCLRLKLSVTDLDLWSCSRPVCAKQRRRHENGESRPRGDTILAMIKSQPGHLRVDTDTVIQMRKTACLTNSSVRLIEKNFWCFDASRCLLPQLPSGSAGRRRNRCLL